jgi:hypothetical protein
MAKPPSSSSTEIPTIRQASDIGPEMLTRLAAKVSPEDIAELIRTMITAEHETKSGALYPDWRAREAGAKLWMSYMIGMPVQRQIVVNETRESTGQTLERLLASPASRRALQSVLDEEQGAVEEENNGVDSNKLVK